MRKTSIAIGLIEVCGYMQAGFRYSIRGHRKVESYLPPPKNSLIELLEQTKDYILNLDKKKIKSNKYISKSQ